MALNAIIIDDEFNARENLKIMLQEHCPELQIKGLGSSAEEGRQLIDSQNPDLVFLDIAMPNEDGFSFLNNIKDRKFSVVFTTAHNEFALKAFKADALDYLEKPIAVDDLKKSVIKVSKYHQKNAVNNSNLNLKTLATKINAEKISIPTRDGYIIINNKDIVNLEASDNYTMIHLSDGSRHLSSKNIKIYEEKLDENVFFRSHKSHIIVNHKKVLPNQAVEHTISFHPFLANLYEISLIIHRW